MWKAMWKVNIKVTPDNQCKKFKKSTFVVSLIVKLKGEKSLLNRNQDKNKGYGDIACGVYFCSTTTKDPLCTM